MSVRVLMAVPNADPVRDFAGALEEDESFELAGVTADVNDGWRLIDHGAADLVLADLSLDSGAGGLLVQRVLTECPGLPVVVVSCPCEEPCVEGLIRVGVSAVVSRHSERPVLFEALRAALEGSTFVDPMLPKTLGWDPDNPECVVESLNGRELAVCRFLAMGYTEQETVARLFMPAWIIRKAGVRGMFKLGVASHEELESLAGCLEKMWWSRRAS